MSSLIPHDQRTPHNWKSKLYVAFAAAVMIVLTTSGLSYWSVRQVREYSRWQTHTYQVIAEIGTLNNDIKDAQRATRGYLITKNRNYLEPYYRAIGSLDEDQARIVSLIEDNETGQKDRMDKIRDFLSQELKLLEESISLRDSTPEDSLPSTILNLNEREMMIRIQSTISDMVQEEKRLLAERTVHQETASNNLNIVLIGSGLTGLGVVAVLLLALSNDYKRRIHTENELTGIYSELQARAKNLENRNREIQQLNAVAESLQTCQTLGECYELIKRHAAVMFPEYTGALYVYSSSRNVVEIVTEWGEEEHVLRFAPDDCWGLRKSRLHVSEGAAATICCKHLVIEGSDWASCIPLTAQGQTIGMLQFSTPKKGDVVHTSAEIEQRMNLATILSEQIAVSLSNMMMRESLKGLSIRDALTGLFNRRYMEETISREFERTHRTSSPLSVISFDVDHFKRVNDTFGHDAGDAVLRGLGAIMKSKTRLEDIACRLGGEEFLMILPGATTEVAARRAEEVRLAMKELTITLGSTTVANITISAGIASAGEHIRNVEDLLKGADEALYAAKKSGRDRVRIHSGKYATEFTNISGVMTPVPIAGSPQN